MLSRLISRIRPEPDIPELYYVAEQEYGDRFTAKDLFYRPDIFLMNIMYEKRFQNRVLFPHFGITTPKTVIATDFNDDFYPLFLKNIMDTIFVDSPEELAYHREQNYYEYCIAQEYIKPASQVASHIRIVVDTIGGRLGRDIVKAASILYATQENEHRSNHRHGGEVIPLTGDGSLAEITEYEAQILRDLQIDPDKRAVPEKLLDVIQGAGDGDGMKFYDLLRWLDFYIGIDAVFGIPFSYNQSSSEDQLRWYFLEAQHGPDNQFLKDVNAWIPSELEIKMDPV